MSLAVLFSRFREHVGRCRPWLRDRGIDEQQEQEWGIGYDYDALTPYTAGRITIPVWHPWSGFPVSVTARSVGGDGPKWMHIPFASHRMVFSKVRRHRIPYLVLVEGPADVIALEHHGISAAALFGVRPLSGWQLGLLGRWTDTFILWPDNDGHPRKPGDPPMRGSLARQTWDRVLTGAGHRSVIGPYPGDEGDPDELVRARPEFVQQVVEQVRQTGGTTQCVMNSMNQWTPLISG